MPTQQPNIPKLPTFPPDSRCAAIAARGLTTFEQLSEISLAAFDEVATGKITARMANRLCAFVDWKIYDIERKLIKESNGGH